MRGGLRRLTATSMGVSDTVLCGVAMKRAQLTIESTGSQQTSQYIAQELVLASPTYFRGPRGQELRNSMIATDAARGQGQGPK